MTIKRLFRVNYCFFDKKQFEHLWRFNRKQTSGLFFAVLVFRVLKTLKIFQHTQHSFFLSMSSVSRRPYLDWTPFGCIFYPGILPTNSLAKPFSVLFRVRQTLFRQPFRFYWSKKKMWKQQMGKNRWKNVGCMKSIEWNFFCSLSFFHSFQRFFRSIRLLLFKMKFFFPVIAGIMFSKFFRCFVHFTGQKLRWITS